MRPILLAFTFLAAALFARGAEPQMAKTRLADGFGLPVGLDGAKQYFKARGFRPNGHLGEDWNGVGGGDTDLGDPVYATAHGLVVFARDYRLGWGNVVIIRHVFLEDGQPQYVDSLYGHLNEFFVREGQQIVRGQKIGTIGNNHGMYDAHLHFEMRKNIHVGMFRNSFPRDFSTYWDPTQFIASHQHCDATAMVAMIPINTFPEAPPPGYAAGGTSTHIFGETSGPIRRSGSSSTPSSPRKSAPFQIDRFGDMRTLGY